MPILKPACWWCGRSRDWSTSLIDLTNWSFVSASLVLSIWWWLLLHHVAANGHSHVFVHPRKMSTPFPNWSHFDFFRCVLTWDGLEVSSTTTSPRATCWLRRSSSTLLLLGSGLHLLRGPWIERKIFYYETNHLQGDRRLSRVTLYNIRNVLYISTNGKWASPARQGSQLIGCHFSYYCSW